MRALVQRVTRASVQVGTEVVGSIGPGALILLGVGHEDGDADAVQLARRCAALRMFADSEERMNLSLKETGGSALVVSQFTLYADTRKGNRPGYTNAAAPAEAERLYEAFKTALAAELGEQHVACGMFRAMMKVELVNDGPVTLLLESKTTAA